MRRLRRDYRVIVTWGPFLPGHDAGERKARLRSLRLAAGLLCGRRASDLVAQLRTAEADECAIGRAAVEFDRLGSVDQRRFLSSYQRVAR